MKVGVLERGLNLVKRGLIGGGLWTMLWLMSADDIVLVAENKNMLANRSECFCGDVMATQV